MNRSRQIQIGLLGLVAILLVVNLLGGFDGLLGGGNDSAKAEARESLTQNNTSVTAPANNAATTATNPANKTVEPKKPTGPTTSVEFDETEFDFGVVEDGEKVSHVYKFTNTGNEPLVITNAKGSCGCTVPSWPKEPIAPGDKGEIKVEFNSKGKKGKQTKRVTIDANIPNGQTFLTIKGEVTPKPGSDNAKPGTASE